MIKTFSCPPESLPHVILSEAKELSIHVILSEAKDLQNNGDSK